MRQAFNHISPIDRETVREQLEASVADVHQRDLLETVRLISDACYGIDDHTGALIDLSDGGDKGAIADRIAHIRIGARAILRACDEHDGVTE